VIGSALILGSEGNNVSKPVTVDVFQQHKK